MPSVRPILPLLLLAALPALTFGGVILDTTDYNNTTYHLIAADGGGGLSWTDAEAFAVTLGGHLATINDLDENDFIFSEWADNPMTGGLWLGLNDVAANSQWVWVSGESSSFTYWQPGEPNNAGGNETYVHMWGGMIVPNGQWNDATNVTSTFGRPIFGVVEIGEIAEIPEPATVGLLSLAALGGFLAWRRRRPQAGLAA